MNFTASSSQLKIPDTLRLSKGLENSNKELPPFTNTTLQKPLTKNTAHLMCHKNLHIITAFQMSLKVYSHVSSL